MAIFAWLLLLPLLLQSSSIATPVDNGVAGEPEVQCSSDSVSIHMSTQNSFEGHVYVKGHYDETGCRTDATNSRSTSIKIPFTACGVRRQRSTNPLGLFVSATIVITFHPMFITKVDRAYNVRCFYMSADKSVTANLDVSMLTTQLITQNIPMPICRYEVLEGNLNGAPVRYAIVGQPVYHKWSCVSETGKNVELYLNFTQITYRPVVSRNETMNIFCMTVHSCLVDDGQNKKVQLLDENGCAQDKYLMGNLNYTGDLQGGIESHVFKYADKPTLFFQCQIRLTLKDGSVCKRTADNCPVPNRGKRSTKNNANSTKVHLNKKGGENFDVFSEQMVVLDVDDNSVVTEKELHLAQERANTNSNSEEVYEDYSGKFCLSTPVFGLIIGILGVALVVPLVVVVLTFAKRNSGK